MTEGEIRFYLREIQDHWFRSNLSADKLAELQAAGLIEREDSPFPVYRLTREGARRKTSGRKPPARVGVSLTGTIRGPRRRTPREKVPPPKGLV